MGEIVNGCWNVAAVLPRTAARMSGARAAPHRTQHEESPGTFRPAWTESRPSRYISDSSLRPSRRLVSPMRQWSIAYFAHDTHIYAAAVKSTRIFSGGFVVSSARARAAGYSSRICSPS